MGLIQRNIQISEEDVRWFENTHPKASLSGLLGMLLAKFREVSVTTPSDYVSIAATKLKEDLE